MTSEMGEEEGGRERRMSSGKLACLLINLCVYVRVCIIANEHTCEKLGKNEEREKEGVRESERKREKRGG